MATVAAPVLTEQAVDQLDRVKCSPVTSELLIVAADVLALLLAAVILAAAFQIDGRVIETGISVLAILIVFLLFRLYPAVGLHPVVEIRNLFTATGIAVLGVLAVGYKHLHSKRDAVVILAWVGGTLLIPLFRGLVRHTCSRSRWWGYPVFVVGDNESARSVVQRLQMNRHLGLRPVAIFTRLLPVESYISGIPVIGPLDAMDSIARRHRIRRVIVAMTGALEKGLIDLIESKTASISQILFVSNLSSPSSLEVQTRDMARMLTIEVPKTLLMPGSRTVKRIVDLGVTAAASMLVAPLLALICIAIKIESPGPAFYSHVRIGRNRRKFNVFKFRSMVVNGEEVLREHLHNNLEAADEWQRTQKLKNDPRITKVGRFLRRTSLDELPQIWNILRGDMSLVGPRPIVETEALKYGPMFSHYMQVAPGLTGMWQVSGRNDTTYEERVELDTYYVRNWSPWLDLYLLARTVVAVIGKKGAY